MCLHFYLAYCFTKKDLEFKASEQVSEYLLGDIKMDRLQKLSLLLDPIAWGMPGGDHHGDLENNKSKNLQK